VEPVQRDRDEHENVRVDEQVLEQRVQHTKKCLSALVCDHLTGIHR
jgi:hypothetical protein